MANTRKLSSTACVLALVAFTPALANPVGGVVVDGSAIINDNGAIVRVEQGSNSAIIDWQTFNVAPGERVEYEQPGATAVTLNRILGPGASLIDGELEAPGRIFIINGDGVIFGDQARIDVNGLLATTMDISNADFMAGDYKFDQPGDIGAQVVNHGVITAADAGMVALVAPNVENSGVIAARLGEVALASGEAFTLDFFGDGLVTFAATKVSGAATGSINVTGVVDAEAGAIYLTASEARNFVETVINVESDLVARSATMSGGKIILSGGDNGKISVSGTLDASGVDGGEIDIAAGMVDIGASGSLLADGAAGGKIAVNSKTKTTFDGAASAQSGGVIEINSDRVAFFNGSAQAGAISANGIEIDGASAFATPNAKGRKTVGGRLSEISENAPVEEDGGEQSADGETRVVIDGRGDGATEGAGPAITNQRLMCLHGVAPGACGASE